MHNYICIYNDSELHILQQKYMYNHTCQLLLFMPPELFADKIYHFDFEHGAGLEVPETKSRNFLLVNSCCKERSSLVQQLICSFKKIFHVWSRFRTNEVK